MAKIVKAKGKWAYGGGGVADGGSNNLGPSKLKNKTEAHTSPTKYGMGDYYGTSMKAPMGRMRSDSVGYRPVNKKKLGTPPKSVV